MNLPAVRARELVEVLGPDALVRRDGRTVELRDPRAATQRTAFTSPTVAQVEEWNASQAWRLGVLANVIAYRCVQLRARAAASVPFVVGRKHGDAKTIVDGAPLAALLGPPPGGPAPKLSARKLIRWTMAQKIVTGRRAWEIETDNGEPDGRPVAFWPLASSELRAFPSKGGNDWFRLFAYGAGSTEVKLRPEFVFYGWEPGGRDFRQAESELQAARFDLSLVQYSDRYSIGFLRNNATPATIITTTKFPSDEAKRAFERNWGAEFGGPDNAGRVYVHEVDDSGEGGVGESISVEVLGLSAKDSKLVEQRKDAMAEVAIALGTPWSKLDASGRTFDNAEAEDRDWWENTILPDLIDLADDINMQLAPRLGDLVGWFDLRGVRALQRKITPISQTVGAPSLVQGRIWTINEAREDYGLEPIDDPDADRLLTVEEVLALSGAVDSGDEAVRAVLAELEQRMPPASPPAPETRAAPEPETRVVDPEQLELRRARIWRNADAVATALEQQWQRAMVRMFARQSEATLARLTGKRGRQLLTEARADPAPQIDPASIFDPEFWRGVTAELVNDLLESAAVAGLSRLSTQFDVSFDLNARWVQEFIEQRAQQLAGQVTQTTYDAIRTELVAGVEGGESIDDLAKRIRQVFQQASDARAETIARTEVISAYNGAATLGAGTLPADVVAGQEWIATRDARTRESHAAADGQIVPIGQPFAISGANAAYPGDPALPPGLSVNCRCTVAFLTPEEMAELTEPSGQLVAKRAAVALLDMVPSGGDDFDFIRWHRTIREVAA